MILYKGKKMSKQSAKIALDILEGINAALIRTTDAGDVSELKAIKSKCVDAVTATIVDPRYSGRLSFQVMGLL